jgi:hypothetical protein
MQPDTPQPENNLQPAPKKSKAPVIIGTIAGVAVIAAAAFGVKALVGNMFSSPASLFASVHMEALEDLTTTLTDSYGTYLEQAQNSKTEGSANMSLKLEDSARSLLSSYTSTDFSWLDTVTLNVDAKLDEETLGAEMILGLNGDDLIALDYALSDSSFYLRLPELSDAYMQFDMSDYLDSDYDPAELTAAAEAVTNTLPAKEVLSDLMLRYGEIIFNGFEDITQESTTYELNGISQKCTLLTASISEEDLAKILLEILPKLKTDQDMEALVRSLYQLASQFPDSDIEDYTEDEFYDEFVSQIDEFLEELEDGDFSDTALLTYQVYVDKSKQIIAMDLSDDTDTYLSYAMPMDGDNFAFALQIGPEDDYAKITGSGTKTSDEESGTFALIANDEELLTLEVERLDIKEAKKGYLNGTFTLTPGAGMTEEEPYLATFALKAVVKNSSDSSELALTVLNSDSPMLTLSLNGGESSKASIDLPASDSTVYDLEDESEILQYMTTLDTDKLISTLEASDIPSEYVDYIEEALEEIISYADYY